MGYSRKPSNYRENMKKRNYVGNLGADGKIIWSVRIQSELILLAQDPAPDLVNTVLKPPLT
jgi:hypothetical protein